MLSTTSRSGYRHCLPARHHRTTTSAVPSTSNRSHRNAGTTNDRKTSEYAAAGNGRRAQGAGTGPRRAGLELHRTPVLISGSAVELAREPGAGAAIEKREAPSQRLYRRHRLPGGSGTGEERYSRAD